MRRGIAIAAATVCAALAQVNVLTYQYDNARTGANTREAILTPTNVNATSFGKLFAHAVDGYVYGQPLYLSNIPVQGKGRHNVVYVVTEHDSVYAFDADSAGGINAEPLWKVSFLKSDGGVTTVPWGDTGGCDQIVPEIGITSTPVIDEVAGTMYVVAMTKENGNYFHRLHALDVTSGAERPNSPVTIQATYAGRGEGGTTLVFKPVMYKQRAGLLLLNGVVYTAFASHCDGGPYHGWLMGYDARSLRQTVVYNNTPDGDGASFWMGGAAPAVDAESNIYLVAGNGTFTYASGGRDLGESFIKLSTSNGLSVADWFTPYNWKALNDEDADIGSAGSIVLPDEVGSSDHRHLLVGSGKEGRIYLLDRDNMGHVQSGSDSQIVQSIPDAVIGLFGNPAYFGKMVYFCGAGDRLKAYGIANAHLSVMPLSQTAREFGFLGCVPSVSANGVAGAIAWAIEHDGILHAYSADNLAIELYNSDQNRARDAFGGEAVKFTIPTVANGKVFAGTQNSLVVYGLLGARGSRLAASNAASGDPAKVAPGSIISIYGVGPANGFNQPQGYPLPYLLAGFTVLVNGFPSPLFFAGGQGQLNAQVPLEVSPGPGVITVLAGDDVVGTVSITVQPVGPGIFAVDGNGPFISVYATGLGEVDQPVQTGAAAPAAPLARVKAPVTATIGGRTAVVSFAGLAPGFAGLYQVNVQVPQLAAGSYPLVISAGGVESNVVTVTVR